MTLPELSEEPWIDNESGDGSCRQVLIDACAAVGVEARYRHQTQDYATALAMVERGLGLTLVPQLGVGSAEGDFSIVTITDPAPVRYIHAVASAHAHYGGPAGDAVRALHDLAKAR